MHSQRKYLIAVNMHTCIADTIARAKKEIPTTTNEKVSPKFSQRNAPTTPNYIDAVTTQAGDTLIIGWPPLIATRLHRATGWSARQ